MRGRNEGLRFNTIYGAEGKEAGFTKMLVTKVS
jgi:hypothetical protein